MGNPKLNIITLQEFEFMQDKDPEGAYDRETREVLLKIIQKLGDQGRKCSRQEKKIFKKFAGANFGILIEPGSESEGKILHPGSVRVEGHFEGEILINQTLTVESTGEVNASISAGTVICRGRIEGDIQALVQIHLFKGATVRGSIYTPSIHVEEGAFFEGRCSMPSEPGEIAIHDKPKPRKFLSAG
jgi:cytoskeletal protein CcmA (bactofilin family)